jgi:hypothetical protein
MEEQQLAHLGNERTLLGSPSARKEKQGLTKEAMTALKKLKTRLREGRNLTQLAALEKLEEIKVTN